jgi:hypothetical protein
MGWLCRSATDSTLHQASQKKYNLRRKVQYTVKIQVFLYFTVAQWLGGFDSSKEPQIWVGLTGKNYKKTYSD